MHVIASFLHKVKYEVYEAKLDCCSKHGVIKMIAQFIFESIIPNIIRNLNICLNRHINNKIISKWFALAAVVKCKTAKYQKKNKIHIWHFYKNWHVYPFPLLKLQSILHILTLIYCVSLSDSVRDEDKYFGEENNSVMCIYFFDQIVS